MTGLRRPCRSPILIIGSNLALGHHFWVAHRRAAYVGTRHSRVSSSVKWRALHLAHRTGSSSTHYATLTVQRRLDVWRKWLDMAQSGAGPTGCLNRDRDWSRKRSRTRGHRPTGPRRRAVYGTCCCDGSLRLQFGLSLYLGQNGRCEYLQAEEPDIGIGPNNAQRVPSRA